MVAGGLEAEIWANRTVARALRRAAARGVSLRLIVGPDANTESLRMLHSVSRAIHRLQRHPDIQFEIADSAHVRYEGEHVPGEPTPENVVSYNNREVAEILIAYADELLETSGVDEGR